MEHLQFFHHVLFIVYQFMTFFSISLLVAALWQEQFYILRNMLICCCVRVTLENQYQSHVCTANMKLQSVSLAQHKDCKQQGIKSIISTSKACYILSIYSLQKPKCKNDKVPIKQTRCNISEFYMCSCGDLLPLVRGYCPFPCFQSLC